MPRNAIQKQCISVEYIKANGVFHRQLSPEILKLLPTLPIEALSHLFNTADKNGNFIDSILPLQTHLDIFAAVLKDRDALPDHFDPFSMSVLSDTAFIESARPSPSRPISRFLAFFNKLYKNTAQFDNFKELSKNNIRTLVKTFDQAFTTRNGKTARKYFQIVTEDVSRVDDFHYRLDYEVLFRLHPMLQKRYRQAYGEFIPAAALRTTNGAYKPVIDMHTTHNQWRDLMTTAYYYKRDPGKLDDEHEDISADTVLMSQNFYYKYRMYKKLGNIKFTPLSAWILETERQRMEDKCVWDLHADFKLMLSLRHPEDIKAALFAKNEDGTSAWTALQNVNQNVKIILLLTRRLKLDQESASNGSATAAIPGIQPPRLMLER